MRVLYPFVIVIWYSYRTMAMEGAYIHLIMFFLVTKLQEVDFYIKVSVTL